MFKTTASMLWQAWREFGQDEAMAKAAALAFYTALGMAPMLLLTIAVASFLPDDVQRRFIAQIEDVVNLQQKAQDDGASEQTGDDVADVIDDMVAGAEQRQKKMSAGIWSLCVGIATLLFSAGGVFSELQTALNKMWDVEPRPGAGLGTWIKKRLLSLGMLLAVLFIMLVSLAISTGINLLLPQDAAPWQWINSLVSLGVFTLIFALIYKILPDVTIAWRDVWVGAAVTALLFSIGKHLISIYLGYQSFTSSYGAAGSLIALLVWVYYSSNIVFFGAELTQVYARRFGSGIHPADYTRRKGAQHKQTPEGCETATA
jgi:membrane protein